MGKTCLEKREKWGKTPLCDRQLLFLSLQHPRQIDLLPEPRGSEEPEQGGGFGSGPEAGEELPLEQGDAWRERSLLLLLLLLTARAAGEPWERSHLHGAAVSPLVTLLGVLAGFSSPRASQWWECSTHSLQQAEIQGFKTSRGIPRRTRMCLEELDFYLSICIYL